MSSEFAEPGGRQLRELQAESITVRIRWFGLAIGFLLVNLIDRDTSIPELNAILSLGVVYALLDSWWSYRGRVFLSEFRLAISFMEALFIGLLCHFDEGVGSPFRFYYFLSMLVCGIRHPARLTVATFALHMVSYIMLGLFSPPRAEDDFVVALLTAVFLGWTTWAIISLTQIIRGTEQQLAVANLQLQQNKQQLEQRIAVRTSELQESQAMLVQQEKHAAFGLLAAGIAHEVGNPLASISSIVQMLRRRDQDDYTGERLNLVDGQLQRIQRILGELVSFSRPASEQIVPIDIHHAISEALNIAKYYKRWKGKTVITDFAAAMPAIRTVHDQVVQVILNLILNALDATEEGAEIRVRTRLVVDGDVRTEMGGNLSEDDAPGPWGTIDDFNAPDNTPSEESGFNGVLIDIEDQGHGIPEDARAGLFRPYFTTKRTGTGLGLFVCRQLIRQRLKGQIELVASGESGSVFRILLPLDPDPNAAMSGDL